MKESNLGLTLRGWFRDISSGGESVPLVYEVAGVSSQETGIIGYAGIGYDGKKKWYLHWLKSDQLMETAPTPYESPIDALKAFAEIRDKAAKPAKA